MTESKSFKLSVVLQQEALKTLRSECEAFLREHASTIGRMEAVSREYDDMRRRAAAMEAELGR